MPTGTLDLGSVYGITQVSVHFSAHHVDTPCEYAVSWVTEQTLAMATKHPTVRPFALQTIHRPILTAKIPLKSFSILAKILRKLTLRRN